MSVFAGGWTLEAAEAVGVGVPDALGLMLQLVDKSLVVPDEGGEHPESIVMPDGGAGHRYRLLETIRQYAQEQLLAADEATAARDRHRDYFLTWAERAAPEVVARDQLLWYARIEAEHDNLRAAIEWSAGDGTARELRLCAALAHFWLQRGYLGEGRERLAGALARGNEAPTRERAVALDWASYMELVRFDRARARGLCEEAVAVARLVGDGRVLATTMRHLATIHWAEVGSTAAVRDALEAAVAAARDADYPREVGYTMSWLGRVVLDLGDEAASLALDVEGRRILREVGDRDALGANLAMSGENALVRGNHAAARGPLEESLVVWREMGNVAGHMQALLGLGDLARAEGDLTIAHARYAEALHVGHANGARSFLRPVTRVLRRLAALSIAAGDPRRAVRIFGAEAAAHGDTQMFQGRRDRWEDDLASARAMLGEAAFASAWAEGRAMTIEEAIAYALGLNASAPDAAEAAGHAR